MATVFRVEKNKGYTVMSNHHLRNRDLTLKAKGLMSQMLSLPDEWDYTLKGLSSINRESIDAIRTAIWELEGAGYIKRHQGRDGRGKMTAIEYTIFEQPPPASDVHTQDSPGLDFPTSVNPTSDNPVSDNPASDNPTLLNTKILITKEQNKESSNTYPINPIPSDGMGADRMEAYRELIMENVEYDIMCEQYGRERMDEVVELLLQTVCTRRAYIRIASDDFPAAVVKGRLLKLNSSHIQYVFDCIDKNTTKVWKVNNYLLTALYNAPTTMDTYYRVEVNHDLYGGD